MSGEGAVSPATEWSTDVAQGEWFTARLDAPHDGIGFLVPSGFEAMARIFHPIEQERDRDEQEVATTTWAAVAAANDRIVHPEMQLHCIAAPLGTRPEFVSNAPPFVSEGELPARERRELAKILGSVSGVDRCWFGVWDGYGQLHDSISRHTRHRTDAPRLVQAFQRLVNRRRVHNEGTAPKAIQNGPRVRAPNRDYLLMRGSLSAVDDAAALVSGNGVRGWSQTPNLWWPDDHSWFVVSEIDFSCTYVCGTTELIEIVLESPVLEALPAERSHRGDYRGDQVNV